MNVHTRDIKRFKQKSSEKISVSFDVFDTFLMRACTTPDGVIVRAFQRSPAYQYAPDATTAYVEHRRQAEARARRKAQRLTGSFEVDIDAIYRCFPYRLFGLTPDCAKELIAAEFDAELELCRVNPQMLARYRELRSSGARTGFISDTYWSDEQLARLLLHCCPELSWDFLFASSSSGTSKGENLFRLYLRQERVDPHRATHIGDNPKADVDGARRHGLSPIHVPQASHALTSIFSRETSVAQLLRPQVSPLLDGGMRTVRRLVAAQCGKAEPAFLLGASVLGPVMQAFDAFVGTRAAALATDGDCTRIAFLGRDGYLPHAVWSQQRDWPAVYLEINRRVSTVASADTLAPIVELIRELPAIDADTFADIVKLRSKRLDAFFAKRRDGRCSGRELAKVLPDLMEKREIAALAAAQRMELMRYLRRMIPDLDACSDLIVVDLGYSGSIQKALRRVFDIEGIKARIHGLYLLSLDDGYVDGAAQDTFEGFISDLVVTPHVKRMLLRNVALLEQMCCAPAGSVRTYRDGAVLHEETDLTPHQHAVAREVQNGVLAYAAAAGEGSVALKIAPFADLRVAAGTAAATLARMLLLPTDDELMLFGDLQHDVNLGTSALTPLLDGELLAARQVIRAFPDACTAGDPPMWLAGSFAALAPAQSFQYLLFGANLLPSDVFGDARCGQLDITLRTGSGSETSLPIACYRTGHGDIRIRIPLSRAMAVRTVGLPLGRLAMDAVVQGPFLQHGDSVDIAIHSNDILKLDGDEIRGEGIAWHGGHAAADHADAMLWIDLPAHAALVAVLSIGLTPLHGARALALD